MKLVYCPKCTDIFALHGELRTCRCGASSGRYTDNINATINGEAIPIGFLNDSFVDALRNQPEGGLGYTFTAFVIPKDVPTITNVGLKNRRAYERIMSELGKDDITLENLLIRTSVVLLTYMDRDTLRELKVTRLAGYQNNPDSYSAWSSPSGFSQSFKADDSIAKVITFLNDYLKMTGGYLIRLHY